MRAHSVVVLNQRRWQSLDGEHGKGVDGLLCMCIIVFAFTVLTKSIWRVKRQFQQSPKFFCRPFSCAHWDSRVLCPNLVMFCSHKSGWCAVELYHAPHLWQPPFYPSPMASSAVQHWTVSPMKEGCHWQAGGENRQTWQLANSAWYP